MANNIVRLDVLSGTNDGAKLKSVKVFSGTTPIAVENGVIVSVGDLTDVAGEREIHKATVVTAGDDTATNIALIATPEVVSDERLDDLADFTNVAGKPARAYMLRGGIDGFSIKYGTAHASEEVAKGSTVVYGDITLKALEKDAHGFVYYEVIAA